MPGIHKLPTLLLTFRRVRVVPMGILLADAAICPMNHQLRSLVACNFSSHCNGFCLCIGSNSSPGISGTNHLPSTI